MIAHDTSCLCRACRLSEDITQADRNLLADAWERWTSATAGEARKLRAGENGALGSPRWVALKAIAAARREGVQT